VEKQRRYKKMTTSNRDLLLGNSLAMKFKAAATMGASRSTQSSGAAATLICHSFETKKLGTGPCSLQLHQEIQKGIKDGLDPLLKLAVAACRIG